VKVNGRPTAFDQIAGWGKGTSISAIFQQQRYLHRDGVIVRKLDTVVARGIEKNQGYQQILTAVLQQAMGNKGYADRAEPFIRLLLESLETPTREKRLSWAKFRYQKRDKQ
jgi:hypothetical protein